MHFERISPLNHTKPPFGWGQHHNLTWKHEGFATYLAQIKLNKSPKQVAQEARMFPPKLWLYVFCLFPKFKSIAPKKKNSPTKKNNNIGQPTIPILRPKCDLSDKQLFIGVKGGAATTESPRLMLLWLLAKVRRPKSWNHETCETPVGTWIWGNLPLQFLFFNEQNGFCVLGISSLFGGGNLATGLRVGRFFFNF